MSENYSQSNALVIKVEFLDITTFKNHLKLCDWNFEALILHQITGGLSNILAGNYKIKPGRQLTTSDWCWFTMFLIRILKKLWFKYVWID